MSHAVRGPLVVDTGVFGARLSPRGKSLALSYQPLLEGRATVVSFVTVVNFSVCVALLALAAAGSTSAPVPRSTAAPAAARDVRSFMIASPVCGAYRWGLWPMMRSAGTVSPSPAAAGTGRRRHGSRLTRASN
jgi:hypothetical protein